MESPHTARAGPLLLQDFHLNDLLSHFDREQIPERVHRKISFGEFTVSGDESAKTKRDLPTDFRNPYVAKTKRGLPGFINGFRTAALADTGAAQNVVSADFAREKGLVLERKTAMFRLGNSKNVRSAGESKQAVEVVAVTIYTC